MLKDEEQLKKVEEIGDAPGVKELAKFAKLWVKAVKIDQPKWTEL